MRSVVAGVRFLSEIALLVGAVAVGVRQWPGVVGWAAGLVLAVVVAGVWGRWIAPKARRRLADPGRLAIESVLFALVGALLATAGSAGGGIALGGVGIAAAVAVRRWAPGL